MRRKAKEIIGAVVVALFALTVSYFRTTFLSRAITICVWLVVVIVYVLVKVKE